MPLDVQGSTRATMRYILLITKVIFENISNEEFGFVTFTNEIGIPSICNSSHYKDYVPALCTHRPSLLPIE